MPGRLSQELVWPSWMQEADEHLAAPGAAYSVPGDSAPPQAFMALEAEDRMDPRPVPGHIIVTVVLGFNAGFMDERRRCSP